MTRDSACLPPRTPRLVEAPLTFPLGFRSPPPDGESPARLDCRGASRDFERRAMAVDIKPLSAD
jgi:hypothetical protein